MSTSAQLKEPIPFLVDNAQDYPGEYVATEDFGYTEVISHSPSPVEAHAKAVERGYNSPVVIYVPASDETHFAY